MKINRVIENLKKVNILINRFLNNQWLRFVFSAIVTLIPYVYIFMTYPVGFRGNDDYSIMNTINGNLTGEPLFYHRYVSVFFSAPISWLYRLNPHIAWYPICMQVVIFLSLTLILWSFISVSLRNNTFIGFSLYAYIIVILTLGVIAIAQLDFTRTSALAGACAIALLLTVDFKNRKKTFLLLTVSVLFILLSSAIRYTMALPIILLYAAIGLCKLFWEIILKKETRVKRLKRIIIPSLFIILCGCVLTYSGNIISNAIISSQENADEQKLIGLITTYRDHPHVEYEGNEELYASIGWSEAYYNLVNKWCFLDEKVNLDTMEKLKSENTYMAKRTFVSTIDDIKEYYSVPYLPTGYALRISVFLAIIIVLALLYNCLFKKVKLKRVLCNITLYVGAWISYAVMMFYVFYNGRFKEHAFFGICLPLLVVSLVILLELAFVPSKTKVRKEKARKVLCLCFYVLICIGLLYTAKDLALNSYRYVYNEEYIKGPIRIENDRNTALVDYAKSNPNKFFICDAELWMSMHCAYQDIHFSKYNLTVWGDSTYATYPSRKQFERNNVDYYKSSSLFMNNVYYVAENECDSDLITYMTEKYGDSVKFELVYSDGNGLFNVYHFEKT